MCFSARRRRTVPGSADAGCLCTFFKRSPGSTFRLLQWSGKGNVRRSIDLSNQEKIQQELIQELASLKQRIAQLEREEGANQIKALNMELQDKVQSLREAGELTERCARAKSEFLSNISHELTTPLNSIMGFSQVLLTKNFGDLNERQLRYVENILRSGERLHTTLENIVHFVRMDVSDPEMDWEDFRLKDVVASSSVFRKAATDRHLTLTIDMAKEADRMIRADRGKLIQVFHQLLSNAAKFSRDGGQITLRVRCRKGSDATPEIK
ncbi:MAG: hypothetical protein C0394_06830 [Syntrophus sp. (in: bacteria)]|nr:hypothetical protein [Syntrophus sp. (in: bacteria)]